MIWTYTDAGDAAFEHLTALIFATFKEQRSPFINDVPTSELFEGDQHGISREDGSQDVGPFTMANGETQIKIKEDFPPSLEEAEEAFKQMAVGLAKDMSMKLWRKIGDDLEKAGRVMLPAKLSPDSIMDNFESVWIEFDENGKAILPQFHCGKELAEKMKVAWQELIESPVHRGRLQEILQRKKDEWAIRENRKFLAD